MGKVVMEIIKWFLHSSVFAVIAAIILSVLVLSILLKWSSCIFVIVKKESFKVWICIVICFVSSAFCSHYSKWGFLLLPIVIVLAFFCYITEDRVLSKADNVKFAVNKGFSQDSLDIWGCICLLALLGPILLNFNIIMCEYYSVKTIGWFKFYWTFKKGVFKYDIIRYAIALTPWIVLLEPIVLLKQMRDKKWLVDLGKIHKEEETYILSLNPDALIGVTTIAAEEEKNKKSEEAGKAPEDEILDIISKFI